MDDLRRIVEIEAIKQLKYRYLRCLDTKRWDELGELFTDDATCAYSGGKYSFRGRQAILGFLRSALGRASMITSHQVHHPEIELVSESEAVGTWALWDHVIDTQHGVVIRGTAFYRDEYVVQRGTWLFRATGYERIWEEMEPRLKDSPVRLTWPVSSS